jgi:amino acid adenylation domain-containing protein
MTGAEVDGPQTLYALLQRAAAESGARPAVDLAGEVISYAGLHERSERLAGLLSRLGAAPGRRVAFCFTKSIDAIATLFGIIRTGATYVPLDPSWPAGRMALICSDAGIGLWTGTKAPEGVSGIRAAVVSQPSGGATDLRSAVEGAAMTGPPLPPANGLANVLYTSGSTGRPKGVEIPTRSLLHFSEWAARALGLTAEDRLANHAPYNFDLSTLDIFAAVRRGAAMCPVPEQLKMFPYPLAKFIADRRISVWYSVPSALIMLQLRGRLAEHDLSCLRHVIFAGEVMPKPALQALAAALPHCRYTNLYGPTETNVCTWHQVEAADLASPGPVPIGRAIAETRLWIVDEESGKARAVGVDAAPAGGELLVAGPTVTTGYLGDGELTSRRLIPAPDGAGPAYRTGDRVSLRDDGVLMFEGRMDRMIKCRGHRVEPGEIEAALAGHPRVKEAAVVALADPVFGNRIKACLSPRDGASLEEGELIAYCRQRLPAYMLPDVWQFYDALPRTDREKVDLQRLMQG